MVLRRKGIVICSIGILTAIGSACGTEVNPKEKGLITVSVSSAIQLKKRVYEDTSKINFDWVGNRSIVIDRNLEIGPPNL